MDGQYRQDGQAGQQDEEDDIPVPEKAQRKQVDQPDHGKKKEDAEDDVGDVDDRRRKIGSAIPVDDIIDKAEEGIGDTNEQGGHKSPVGGIKRGGGIGIHMF